MVVGVVMTIARHIMPSTGKAKGVSKRRCG
jgi:hypothetical protein